MRECAEPLWALGRMGGAGGRRKDALVNKPRLLRERTMRCGSGARWEWRDVYSSSSPHREPRRVSPPPLPTLRAPFLLEAASAALTSAPSTRVEGWWKLREPPSWGQCKTLGWAGDAGLRRLAGLYLHAGPAGNRGADGREDAPLQFEGSIICPLSGLYVLLCFCSIHKIEKLTFFFLAHCS